MTWLLVALGAGLGAAARYLADRAARRRWGNRFPWGILLVNVTGSLALGLLVGRGTGPAASALLASGFCGAFTTWSTLAVDAVVLGREGRWGAAALDITVSVVGGLAAVGLGIWLGGRTA